MLDNDFISYFVKYLELFTGMSFIVAGTVRSEGLAIREDRVETGREARDCVDEFVPFRLKKIENHCNSYDRILG